MAYEALHDEASVTSLTFFSTLPWLTVPRFTGLLVHLQVHWPEICQACFLLGVLVLVILSSWSVFPPDTGHAYLSTYFQSLLSKIIFLVRWTLPIKFERASQPPTGLPILLISPFSPCRTWHILLFHMELARS